MIDHATWPVRVGVVAALGLLTLLACGAFLATGRFPQTHDLERYVVLGAQFRGAMEAGILYPRWLPDLAGGYGYPTFCFYQPLFFYASSLIGMVTGASPAASALGAIALFMLYGICGAYLLARRFGGIGFSLAAAAMFTMTPYLYVNLYVRGDFSELASMTFLPWSALLLLCIRDAVAAQRSCFLPPIGLALTLGMLVTAHPVTALVYFGLFPFLALGALWELDGGRQRALLLVAGAYLASLALTLPYWGPVFQLKAHAYLDHAVGGYFVAHRHAVPWRRLFSPQWGFNGMMSHQLGAMHFLAAVSGLWWGRRSRFLQTVAVLYAVLLLLLTPLSSWIWAKAGILAFVQFPWRLLAILATLQLIGACGWATQLQSSRRLGLAWVFLAAAAAIHAPQFRMSPDSGTIAEMNDLCRERLANLPHTLETFTIQNEFLPRTAREPAEGPRGNSPLLTAPESATVHPLPDHTKYRLRYAVRTPQPNVVRINQFYFPGWRVELNGVPVGHERLRANLSPDGRMHVELPPGESVVDAWYSGPPGGGARALVMIAMIGGFLVLLRREGPAPRRQ